MKVAKWLLNREIHSVLVVLALLAEREKAQSYNHILIA